ncbi:MAG: glycoside hydrolase family 43 protein [Lachnospiraceae bacterium]|nr:glycoside hydrolase family 43 protein [Lachnospiraceae bacterium]
MNIKLSKLTAAFLGSAMLLTLHGAFPVNAAELSEANGTETLSGTRYTGATSAPLKTPTCNNPISSEVFCADPTSVEYNGRLYVFGTNDHQQYEEKGADADNTYERIKSLVIFSTEDMVNWVYHGTINVGEIAPWIVSSWAPSIESRVEADGLTHFYLYFSNNGTGVGVLTATDPLGPWSDPLGEPLISYHTPGLTDCPNPFDPGVLIDENGVGWLTFGGGKSPNGTDAMPGSARIVQLGDDMLSFASDFKEIPAPYFFEASELNYINGTYVYTYNSDWSDHSLQWDYDVPAPSQCSMVYMTTKTPLDPDSWEVRGEYFPNPGSSGFSYSNNHTHLQKYKGSWYLLFHTLSLKAAMGIQGGYRSLCVNEIAVDEEQVRITKTGGTKAGVVTPAAYVDPYAAQSGAALNSTADVTLRTEESEPLAVSDTAGAWTSVRNVTFSEPNADGKQPTYRSLTFLAEVTGTGRIEVRLDSPNGALLTSLDFASADTFTTVYNKSVAEVGGTHELYFVFSGEGIAVKSWRFDDTEAEVVGAPSPTAAPAAKEETAPASPDGRTAALLAAGVLALAAIVFAVLLRKKRKKGA